MNYRVDMSDVVMRELTRVKEVGRQIGLGQVVPQALYAVMQHLRTDPHSFGDPGEELHHLKLKIRKAFLNPLSVKFAINDEHRVVYVMKVQLPIT